MNRQDSVTSQMDDLYRYALSIGAYDAADWLKYNFYEKTGTSQNNP